MTEEKIKKICDEIKDLLVRKNSNYGSSVENSPFLLPWVEAETAIYIRLSDKFARLKNLLAKEPDKVGESRLDTIKDIVGYGILLLALDSEGQKTNEKTKENRNGKL